MAALNSLVRRVSGSFLGSLKAFTKPISGAVNLQNHNFVGKTFIPHLRFSTSTATELLRALDSDISSSFTDSNQGNPFNVEENHCNLALLTKEDGSLVFSTTAGYEDKSLPGPRIHMHGAAFTGNNLQVEYYFKVQPDDALVSEMTICNVLDDKMTGFEKVFDNLGINRKSMMNFLLEEFRKEGCEC